MSTPLKECRLILNYARLAFIPLYIGPIDAPRQVEKKQLIIRRWRYIKSKNEQQQTHILLT